jgi:hypothetical protein
MRFARQLLIFFMLVLFVQNGIFAARPTQNPEWNSECTTELYQVYKKFCDSIKKFEQKKELTKEESEEVAKYLRELQDSYDFLVAECQSAYEYDLLLHISQLAEKEGREDIVSLLPVSCRQTEEVLSEVIKE